jgi:hypothetical protein
MENPVFTVCVQVKGGLISSFVFESEAQADKWMKTDFVQLCKEYGKLTAQRFALPGLRVGDLCNVWGEAQDQFRIVGLKKYSAERWAFILDSGWSEEVAKCHTEFL